jgi:NhaP-type Na+/H+ or K+/H+ antiporter
VAIVKLSRYEIEEYDPPKVCMKCGARSTAIVRKTFSWYPPWIGITILVALLVYIILVAVLTKRMTVPIPLCDKHKGHWTKRTLITLLGLLGVLGLVGLAIAASTSEGDLADMAGAFWGIVLVSLLVWLIVIIVLQYTAIRPSEITDKSITLTGVSSDYADAIREERGDSYDDDRPRRSRRRDDDYEDDRPRKRRQAPEDEDDEAPRPKARDKSEGVYDPKKSKRRQEDSEAIQGDDD